jgi:hypothetical protein
MEKKWSTGVGNFSEALWICSPSTIISCSIRGIIVEAHLDPTMEVNIMPWHIAYTLLGNVMLRPSDKLLKSYPSGNVTLRPSDKLLKSYPSGHILECRGVACVVLVPIHKMKVNQDFHTFDVMDLQKNFSMHLEGA